MPSLETYDINGNPITSSAPSSQLTSVAPKNYSPQEIQGRIALLAPQYGVDPQFAQAVAKQESGFNNSATSSVGARGIFQLMPETAKNYGVDVNDPDQNIRGGLKYLGDLNKKYKGDRYKTLVEYNSGPKNVDKPFEQLPEETQEYVTNILGKNAGVQHLPTEVYDINGNPVGANISQSSFNRPPLTSQQVQAHQGMVNESTGIPYYIQKYGQYAPEVLGAFGGLTPGAPNLGSAIGSGLGEIVAGSAEHGVPNTEDFKRALEGGLLTYGTGKAFQVPGLLKRSLTNRLINKPAKAAKDVLEQGRQEITGGIPSGETKGAQDVLAAKLAPVREQENADWEKVNKRLDKASHVLDIPTGETDPQTHLPVTLPKTVRGPIKLSKDTLDFLNQSSQELSNVASKFPNPDLVSANQILQRAKSAMVVDKNGDAYLPFDEAKQLRSNIGQITSAQSKYNLTSGTKSIGLQRGGGIQVGLRDKLGSDIEDSLIDEDPSGQLLKDYGTAVGMTKTRVKASLFDKTMSKYINQDSGMLDVEGAINAFTNPTNPTSKQFTAAERNSIVKTLQSVRNVSPQYDGALRFTNGQWLFTAGYAIRHPVKFAIGIASKDMFEKLMSQPKYARLVQQLPSAPANSSQAHFITKSLMGALKSVPAEMIAPSGIRVKSHIDENGNAIPDFQMSAQ